MPVGEVLVPRQELDCGCSCGAVAGVVTLGALVSMTVGADSWAMSPVF